MLTYLGVSELAHRLGVHQGTILRHIAEEKITPDAYVGPRPLFTKENAEQLRRRYSPRAERTAR